jgi:hypothetical protein
MKEFMFIFRQPDLDTRSISPDEFQKLAQKWQKWKKNIEQQGKLGSNGNRLSSEGKVLKPGGIITDGPFVEIREILGGFMMVKAEDLDEAATLAHGCPFLDINGSVEIRPLHTSFE